MKRLGEQVPDVLLSDIGMPEEDGYDLIRRVRALPRDRGGDVPAAALTAYARPEDRRRLLNAGYSMHLPKPIEPAELVAVVATLTRFMHRSDGPTRS
jgi:CheY-like chemotaxis protein